MTGAELKKFALHLPDAAKIKIRKYAFSSDMDDLRPGRLFAIIECEAEKTEATNWIYIHDSH